MSGPQVPREVRDEMHRFIGMNFAPKDYAERPPGSPDHIHNYVDMFEELFDEMLSAHTKAVTRDGLTTLQHLQLAMGVFAVTPLDYGDVAALFCIAMDRAIRANLDKTTETKDSVE